MVGSESVIVALKELSGIRTIALGGTGVIDNTRDWRRRLIKVTALASNDDFAWNNPASLLPYSSTVASVTALSNSFTTGSYAGGHSAIFIFTPTQFPAMGAGSFVGVYVNQSTGAIMAEVSATDPAFNFVLWIEASGQFNNAF